MCSRRSKKYVAKEEKEAKTFNFVDTLFNKVMKLKESGVVVKAKAKKDESVPKNIAPIPRPDKNEILEKRLKLTRFNK